MESMIRMFKAVEVDVDGERIPTAGLLGETIKRGFVFSPKVVANYSDNRLIELIEIIEKEVGLTAERMNSSFHKSWGKVKDAPIEQLFIEQIVHYITTYGFEALGIYNENTVYIPNEKLEIPGLNNDIKLVVINGYTKGEFKMKLLRLLQSGIALNEDTVKDCLELAYHLELDEHYLRNIKNKEVMAALYDYLNIIPENPIEFLRYAIYKSINKTLLIKDAATIEEIKTKENLDVLGLFVKYKNQYGLEKLAQIFNRYKPIFLAFRTNRQMKHVTNRIRKLSKKYHIPMPEDYLNSITAKIKNGEKINPEMLTEELSRVNTFRKIRLAYALKYRTQDVDSILYRVRNGKGYATTFDFKHRDEANRVLGIVLESITADVRKNVDGKRIYIPEDMVYTLPTTEKMFTGDFPSGSYITIPKDMIVGIHWENVDYHRIDLDLSMVNANSKIGWDAGYRSEDRKVLFSGDLTDAPKPKGATELFYVAKQTEDAYILFVNYYNYDEDVEVPLKILVAKANEKITSQHYAVNPNEIITVAKTNINKKQKVLGLLVTTPNDSRFYFAETNLGKNISSSSGSDFVENSRKYLFDFYTNAISLNDVLEKAGAILVDDGDTCDIDLSPEKLEKDMIINLVR